MDCTLFERLLYEEESPTLDFKRDQYRFVKASDDDKSELLKDILGFVNAWRRSEAYILIGVEDVRGGRANVVGIQPGDQLDDHSLQQFVNNLTNRPVRFHYEAFGFENKQVGIIRIEDQPRPVYLKQDYGKLRKNDVYVRRGSSTDPRKPATPEEISQMGLSGTPQAAELVVQFADPRRDASLGDKLACEAEYCQMPKAKKIPDLAPPESRNLFGIDTAIISDPFNKINADYFRELASYEFCKRLYSRTRLLVENVGHIAAKGVRIELETPVGVGVHVAHPWDLPDVPQRRSRIGIPRELRRIQSAANRSPGGVTIDKNKERYRVEVECGDLQPGRRVWSEAFSVGMGATGESQFVGRIFAENLAKPKDVTLILSATITNTTMTVEELVRLPTPAEDDGG